MKTRGAPEHPVEASVTWLGCFLLPLYAPLGAVVVAAPRFLRTVLRRGPAPSGLGRIWIVAWVGFWVPLALALALQSRWSALLMISAQTLVALAAGWWLGARPGVARSALLGGLLALVAVMTAVRVASPVLWHDLPNDNGARALAERWMAGGEVLREPRTRRWRVASGTDGLSLDFSARRTSGDGSWRWLLNGAVRLEAVASGDGRTRHGRLIFGERGDPFAQRYFELDGPAGGRRFRVELDMRSDQMIEASGCRGVWLQVWGSGGGRSCRVVDLGPEWTRVEHTWRVPAEATSRRIRVVLNDFDGHAIEVRDVRLYEARENGWTRRAPLTPEGVTVTLAWRGPEGMGERTTELDPDDTWTQYSLAALQEGRDATEALVTIAPSGSLAIAIRDARVRTPGGPARPLGSALRQGLWTGQPNLLAHGTATLGIAAAALGPTASASLAALGVTAAALWFTGSRTATAAALLGGCALILLMYRQRRFFVGALAAATVGVLIVIAVGGRVGDAGAFLRGEITPRTQIWEMAWSAFLEHPVRGLEGAGVDFTTFWTERVERYDERITHGHNLWLEWMARYGIAGLLSTAWLTAALVIAGRRTGRVGGSVLVATVLAMNLVDVTIFFPPVLFGLAFGLNAIARGPEGTRREMQRT